MAKAKAKKKAATRKFYIGYSECGDISQFEVEHDYGPFASAEAAKNKIDKEIASGEWSIETTYHVFEIIHTGKPSGILNWK